MADDTRRKVFEQMRGGSRSVGEIAAQLPVSRPAVSHHLKVLKEAGLVTDHAEGTRRVYSINLSGLGELRHWLDQFWDIALEAFKAHVEESKGELDRPVKHAAQDSRRARSQKRSRQRRRRTRL
nr:metalloregulator ArsR/SmtB family transcription factor [uncultured Steroidobacter sp.]